MSEEDQMLRAIAMSLGQDISMEQRAELPEVQYKISCGINGVRQMKLFNKS